MTEDTAGDIQAWSALARAHRMILDAVEAALKQSGLPPLGWYDVLLELDRAGPDGLRPGALQERLLLPQYGLSRLLARIVGAGLIERRPCPDDRRGFVVALTAEGARMRRRMWPIYRAAVRSSIGMRLDDSEVGTLTATLRKLA